MFWLLLWRCPFLQAGMCVPMCSFCYPRQKLWGFDCSSAERPVEGKLAVCVCAYMQATGIGHRVEGPPVRKEGKGRKEEGGVNYTFGHVCVKRTEWSRYGKGNQRWLRKETIHSFLVCKQPDFDFRLFCIICIVANLCNAIFIF